MADFSTFEIGADVEWFDPSQAQTFSMHEVRSSAGDPETVAPSVTLVSPLNGTLAKFAELVIDVTDASGFAALNISIELPSGEEVIYRAGAFTSGYSGSERSIIANGFRLTIARKLGWPVGTVINLNVDPVDTKGNVP